MRLKLDNGINYDINAMFTLNKVNRGEAWAAFKGNFSAWPKGLVIPLEHKTTTRGLLSWLVVFTLYTVSLLILPLLCLFGYSTYAYSFFTKSDAEKLKQYKSDLKRVYSELSNIEDQVEYKKRLKEEITKIKPF